MNESRSSAVWPFLVILVCLFLLSLSVPRSWQPVARREPIDQLAQRMGQAIPARRDNAAANWPADPYKAVAVEPAPATLPSSPLPRGEEAAVADIPIVAAPLLLVPPASLPAAEPVQPRVAAPVEPPGESPRVALRPTPNPARPPIERPSELPPASPPALSLDRASSTATAAPEPSLWAEPAMLLEQLERLTWRPQASGWALSASDRIRDLLATAGPHDIRAAAILEELSSLAQQSADAALQPFDPAVAVEFRLAKHALQRRLDIWQRLQPLVASHQPIVSTDDDRANLLVTLDEIATATAVGGEVGTQWQNYLLVDTLRGLARDQHGSESLRRAAAQRVLIRLEHSGLSAQQKAFVSAGPLVRLNEQLRHWAVEPVDARLLLADLERFEQTGLPSDARRVAERWRLLSFAPDDPRRDTAHWLEQHYRNANLRVAVSGELLNRLLPAPEPEHGPLHDTVLGLPTRGWSNTSTRLGIRLLPDTGRLRFLLEAQGLIAARTRTDAGAVTLHGRSRSTFVASKPIEFGPEGLRLARARVEASQEQTQLDRVESGFEVIPVLGALVEHLAREEHANSLPAARREVESKVVSRVEQQFDAQTTARIEQAHQRFREKLLTPLAQLGLPPDFIDLQTTDSRLIMRFRLAADDQLAANTPRPRAPADSLASLQIHQSLLNNVAERLELNGQTFDLAALREHVARRLGLDPARLPATEHDDARITFAADDAIRLRCDSGRIELALSIAALESAPRAWRNFTVRVRYRADDDIRRGSLARDGVVLLQGERLSLKEQLPLRGIFTKMFPPERRLHLLPEAFAEHPTLADLEITQLDIRDGWLGLALGPARPTDRLVQRPGP